MQIQAVNRRAQARYSTFWSCLVMVNEVMVQARKVAEDLRDVPGNKRGFASAEEIRASARKAEQSLLTLSKSAQRWEIELKSREWRV